MLMSSKLTSYLLLSLTLLAAIFSSQSQGNNFLSQKLTLIQVSGYFYLFLTLIYSVAVILFWNYSKTLRKHIRFHFFTMLFYLVTGYVLLNSKGILPLFFSTCALAFSFFGLYYSLLFTRLTLDMNNFKLTHYPEWYQKFLNKLKEEKKKDFLSTVDVARCLNETILWCFILIFSFLALASSLSSF